jgi:signal transduction histidine kinase
VKAPSFSFSLHGLRAQVLLWTALPLTILLIIFAFSGVSSHQSSMRILVVEENSRLVSAFVRLISSQRENYAWRNDLPVEQVQADHLDLNTLLAVEHPHAVGTVALLDADGKVLFSRGNVLRSDEMLRWSGIADVLAGKTGVFFTSETIHGDVIAYAPVPNTGWSLVIREAWHSLTDPIIQIEQVMPLVLFTATAISLLTLFFGLRYVVQPLQELGSRANLIGQGQFDAIAKPVGGVQEIEDLRLTLSDMAAQLQNYQTALHDYLRAITQAQEEERARIGRELHDETIQTLIALGHKAQMIQRHFERASPQTNELITDLRQMVAQSIEEVRRFSHALRPPYLDELGLQTSLEMLAREVGAEWSVSGSSRSLNPEKELTLYRVAQEALNNARRHAQAEKIAVELQFHSSLVVLCIDDNGKGFELPANLSDLTHGGHFGLIGMRERTQLVNGQLKIISKRSKGTTIILTITT